MAQSDLHYETYRGKLILRDHLANCRTVLANQRTLLAYARTALTLVVAGLTFIKFFEHLTFEIIGWIFVPIGLVVMSVGVLHYRRTVRQVIHMNRAEAALKQEAESDKPDPDRQVD
jgi:putative membrane protein